MQLDEIVQRIEGAFGEASPLADRPLTGPDIETLRRIFGEDGYEVYQQDQVNRQIIRDYLVNAVLLDIITENRLAAYSEQVATEEGRATMALHMLMSSVEDANDLPYVKRGIEVLEPLRPVPDSHPHLKLVPS